MRYSVDVAGVAKVGPVSPPVGIIVEASSQLDHDDQIISGAASATSSTRRWKRLNERRRWTLGLLTAGTLITTGCTMTQLPTYDTVREETRAAMQRVVDEMPRDSRVEQNPNDTPFGCDGGGVFYTGQWTIHPTSDFDGQEFVDGLPEALGSDFAVEETDLDLSYPAVSLIANAYAGSTVDVSVLHRYEEVVVDILATSRCAHPPASPTPQTDGGRTIFTAGRASYQRLPRAPVCLPASRRERLPTAPSQDTR